MLRILTFTNLYPNPEQPDRGNFIAQMLQLLGPDIKNRVICPLPWYPPVLSIRGERSIYRRIPFRLQNNGNDIYYPKYFLIPKISGMFHPIIIMARCYALIKKLIKAESIDLIHGHWIYPDCVAAVWIARSLSIPVVVSARGCDINLYKDYRVRRLQIMSALKHADAITAVSDSLRNTIINDFRIDAKKAVTIRNGVDPNQFKRMTRAKARTIVGLRQGVKYLIFVGALDEVKGLNYLIRALGDLKKSGDLAFHTLFIGEGPEREQIQKQIIQLGLRDEVELIGAKPHEEIPIWMNACDVLCLPSIREGTPNVIIEALACGLPVVATNVGGIPEIVKKSNAILVPPKDTRSLAHAVYTFFSGERQNNRSPIAVSTWRDCAQKYVDLYLSVLRERGSGFHTQKNTLSGV